MRIADQINEAYQKVITNEDIDDTIDIETWDVVITSGHNGHVVDTYYTKEDAEKIAKLIRETISWNRGDDHDLIPRIVEVKKPFLKNYITSSKDLPGHTGKTAEENFALLNKAVGGKIKRI